MVVRSVVEDEGFQLPSPPAVKALDAATSLLEWITGCEANRAIAAKFSSDLVSYLLRCFPAVGSKLDRVKMWHKFHMMRTSKDFFPFPPVGQVFEGLYQKRWTHFPPTCNITDVITANKKNYPLQLSVMMPPVNVSPFPILRRTCSAMQLGTYPGTCSRRLVGQREPTGRYCACIWWSW